MEPHHEFPSVTEFGFMFNHDNRLEPVMTTQLMAPPELLNDLKCECDICDEDCPCFKYEQPCTSSCNCKGDSGDTDNGICVNIYTLKCCVDIDDIDSDSDEANELNI